MLAQFGGAKEGNVVGPFFTKFGCAWSKFSNSKKSSEQMAFLTTNPSPFIINVPELQNVITSAVGDAGLSNTILALQTLINTTDSTANLSGIGSVDGSAAITVRNDLNLSNASIQFLGSNLLTSNVVNGVDGFLAIEVAGTEVGRFTGTGLGLGTATPATLLDVAGPATIRGLLTLADGVGVTTGTVAGSVIATAPSQRLAFWGAAADVQPTTAIAAAAFAGGTSGIADDSATFGGYTLGQVVAALQRVGILA